MGRAALAALADLHGVATTYSPSADRILPVPDSTVVAVLAALGMDASTDEAVRRALAAHEEATRARLLPETVVLWQPAAGATTPGTSPGAEPVPAPAPKGGPAPTPAPGAEPVPTPAPVNPLAALPTGTRVRVRTEQGGLVQWTARPGAGGTTAGEPGRRPHHPPELPLGVHALKVRAPDGRRDGATLIVAPGRLPEGPERAHGFLVQLYSLLSARSWGMGDLGDLGELAVWSGRTWGASFVQVNPLHAAVPGTPTDPSPYRPSSRRFPDPVHLRIEDIPEYAYLTGTARARAGGLLDRAAELRESVLGKGALIDRDAVWAVKREALELVREVPLTPGRSAAYHDFLAGQGQALEDHATWCALTEMHGPEWRGWPEGLRDPRSKETARARAELIDRVDFHSWLAWLTDSQLAAAQRHAHDAGMAVGLVHDLAVGVHPSGADAWAQQEAFAAGMSVGAPPDAFNSRGQDWGLPPWRPDALAASGYGPYRGLLRGLLRHAGALRIDHVMGLFRLWWVPQGCEPTEGTYVRYDAEAMLGVLVLEAHRAGALVVGEDLGTVETGVRDALAARGVLGTSVLWFERDWTGDGLPLPPARWRTDCVATATTHDLPSTAARLTGEHVGLRHRLGLLTRPLAEEQAEDAAEVGEWLAYLERLGLLPEGPGDEEGAVRAVYRFLRRTPARMIGVWLPDTVGDRRPQNLPGTWDEYPNWRLPVADARGRPVSLEDLVASPRLHALMSEFVPDA
ncbi:4-alpha-glucanotransferase [Streptomyces sp. GC420]|uniref:4-alpha-glucanotransferase n=1 Tax=Streptomyces sp. GC420 TaxID=2697568 RepID=UPI00141521FD|nr:4-alpha-glucanotransferase [Streptomyces sp. GC420]NBM16338.1 4-alpha-glucanotransferase [Streptomyces sp. GC420]